MACDYPIRRIPSPNNLFMSHSWSADLRGRSTHDRVRSLKDELKRHGWKVWFDEERLLLGSNIDTKMATGIRDSDAVCICITRSYLEKINAQDNNCAKEWNLAQSLGKKILPIVLEEEMLDCKSWPPGIVTMYLGNTFYIDVSSDNIVDNARRLSDMLLLLGLTPRLQKSHSWPRFHGSRVLRARGRTSSARNLRAVVHL